MNVAAVLAGALACYVFAHRFYARRLASAFGEDPTRPTPAHTENDGVDYVPTRPHVLFAHHFTAIAAAGPILGPTMALLYGYAPAFIWIVLGAVLIGAVHDFACLFVSMREGGKSIAEIARRTLGQNAFLLFALFIVFNLVVVNAVFINLTAVSLTSIRSLTDLGLDLSQTIFRTTVGPQGTPVAHVGGIASTSAIVLTLLAPLLGILVIKRRMRETFSYPLGLVLCVASVVIGFALPVAVPAIDLGPVSLDSSQVWVVLIALYVWLAAAAPVWLILQPREFVSVQFLYLGIGLLVIALLAVGIQGETLQAPATAIDQGEHVLGSLWPVLFVTVACGAVSGFHGLVASGTTSKQISNESHAKHVGYLGMLGESALALCVTLAIAGGISYAEYTSFLVPPADAAASWKANPVLAFSVGVAGIAEAGLGIPKWLGLVFGLLMVEGFVLDTLDVSVRLNRYLLEEIWSGLFGTVPRLLRSYWFNSGISVALMLALAVGNTAQSLWPIFGTGNQLLASLTLVTLAVWFYKQKRPTIYVFAPAVLVGTTTLASLIYLLGWKYIPAGNYLLATTAVVFLLLALGVLGSALTAFVRARAARASP